MLAVVFEIKLCELRKVLNSEDDHSRHCSVALAIDVGRVLVKPVIVSENEIPRHFCFQKLCKGIKWQVKKIVALPVHVLRHHVECDSNARMCEDAHEQLLEVRKHLVK